MPPKQKWDALSNTLKLREAMTLALLALDSQAEAQPESRRELLTARDLLAQEKARRFNQAKRDARRQAAR